MRKPAEPEGSNYNNTAVETITMASRRRRYCYKAGWISEEGRDDLQKGVLRSSRHFCLQSWSVIKMIQAPAEISRLALWRRRYCYKAGWHIDESREQTKQEGLTLSNMRLWWHWAQLCCKHAGIRSSNLVIIIESKVTHIHGVIGAHHHRIAGSQSALHFIMQSKATLTFRDTENPKGVAPNKVTVIDLRRTEQGPTVPKQIEKIILHHSSVSNLDHNLSGPSPKAFLPTATTICAHTKKNWWSRTLSWKFGTKRDHEDRSGSWQT